VLPALSPPGVLLFYCDLHGLLFIEDEPAAHPLQQRHEAVFPAPRTPPDGNPSKRVGRLAPQVTSHRLFQKLTLCAPLLLRRKLQRRVQLAIYLDHGPVHARIIRLISHAETIVSDELYPPHKRIARQPEEPLYDALLSKFLQKVLSGVTQLSPYPYTAAPWPAATSPATPKRTPHYTQ